MSPVHARPAPEVTTPRPLSLAPEAEDFGSNAELAAVIPKVVALPPAGGGLLEQAAAAPGPTLSGDARRGSRGADVKSLQGFLGVASDGVFGRDTQAAVRSFQRAKGLVADGIVGPDTRRALAAGRAENRGPVVAPPAKPAPAKPVPAPVKPVASPPAPVAAPEGPAFVHQGLDDQMAHMARLMSGSRGLLDANGVSSTVERKMAAQVPREIDDNSRRTAVRKDFLGQATTLGAAMKGVDLEDPRQVEALRGRLNEEQRHLLGKVRAGTLDLAALSSRDAASKETATKALTEAGIELRADQYGEMTRLRDRRAAGDALSKEESARLGELSGGKTYTARRVNGQFVPWTMGEMWGMSRDRFAEIYAEGNTRFEPNQYRNLRDSYHRNRATPARDGTVLSSASIGDFDITASGRERLATDHDLLADMATSYGAGQIMGGYGKSDDFRGRNAKRERLPAVRNADGTSYTPTLEDLKGAGSRLTPNEHDLKIMMSLVRMKGIDLGSADISNDAYIRAYNGHKPGDEVYAQYMGSLTTNGPIYEQEKQALGSRPPAEPKAATPKAATPAPKPTAPAPAWQTRLDEEYGPLLKALDGAKTDEQRKSAALAVAGWNRANLVDQPDVQAYLSRTDVAAEEKTATMNALALEVARSEFLAGWAWQGGVGTNRSWETDGKNSGPFATRYQQQVSTVGKGDGQAWCTSFVGSAFKDVGFQFDPSAKAEGRSPFWSGLRLDHWARTGKNVDGRLTLAPEGSRVVDSASGGRHDTNFSSLTASLNAAKDKKGVMQGGAALAGRYADRNGGFLPGDVLVLDTANKVDGSSHTVMVDRYDPETQTISTIEGNKNDKVTSTRIDLKDPAHAAQIASRTRLGAESFMTPETLERSQGPKADAGPNAVGAEALLARARSANARLAEQMLARGQLGGKAATDSVLTWSGKAAEGLHTSTR